MYRSALRYPGGSCGVPDGRERRTHLAAIIHILRQSSPVRSRTSHGLRAALAAQFGHTSIPAGDTHTQRHNAEFSLPGLTLGGHPTFDGAAGLCSKNDLAPSSDRVERAIDTCFHPRMIIFHHTIDSGGPSGDPWTPDPNA